MKKWHIKVREMTIGSDHVAGERTDRGENIMTKIEIVEMIEDVIAALSCCEQIAGGGVDVILADQAVKLRKVSGAIECLPETVKE